MFYAQNQEDKIISEYFGQFKGVFLDIGANDGITLSNTHLLALKGWKGIMFEPSPKAFKKLQENYKSNQNILLVNMAVGSKHGNELLHESGELLGNGDVSLVSSIKKEELQRWKPANIKFTEVEVPVITFDDIFEMVTLTKFDFISIDAEGMDLEILRQIDLASIGCRCLVIEWNSLPYIASQIKEYVESFGLREIHRNGENLIFAII